MMKARSYDGLHDLRAMLDLLSAGGKADNGTHYVHRGDLQWWLFYTDTPQEVWQPNIRLWMEGDHLVGWALLSPDENAFDVFTAPELRGDPRQYEMLAWAVENMPELDVIDSLWNAEGDTVRIGWLEGNGFTQKEFHDVYFRRSLRMRRSGRKSPLMSTGPARGSLYSRRFMCRNMSCLSCRRKDRLPRIASCGRMTRPALVTSSRWGLTRTSSE